MTVTSALFNKEYTITAIHATEPLKSRLLSFGFAKGNTLVVLQYTLTKQTYDIKIEDSHVALRKEEAQGITIEEKQ